MVDPSCTTVHLCDGCADCSDVHRRAECALAAAAIAQASAELAIVGRRHASAALVNQALRFMGEIESQLRAVVLSAIALVFFGCGPIPPSEALPAPDGGTALWAEGAAGGSSLMGFRDAQAADAEVTLRDAGPDASRKDAGAQDVGPLDAGCADNGCGGCGPLACPAGFDSCALHEPCTPCPDSCGISNDWVERPFLCDGPDALHCPVCDEC